MESNRTGRDLVAAARPPMNPDLKEMMMYHLLRCPEVFRAAESQLQSRHFDHQLETGYLLVWDTTREFWNKHRTLPGRDALLTLITQRLDDDPDCLVEEARVDLERFVWAAYDSASDNLLPVWGLQLLQDFLRERELGVFRRDVSNLGNDVPLELPRMVDDLYRRFRNIEYLQADTGQAALPDGCTPEPLRKHPTGLIFLDKMLNGGQAAKEVYGLLGPTGGGKSLCALQIAVEGAKYQQFIERTTGQPAGHWFVFSYELPLIELRIRVMSYAAEIHRSVLEEARDWEQDLRRADNPREYEVPMFRMQQAAGAAPIGEWDRFQMARQWVNRNLWLLDMGEQAEFGGGGLRQIAAVLDYNQRVLHRRISGVVVDYVGEMADRYIAASSGDFGMKRHYISSFASESRTAIATAFDCPVWLVHQLAGAVNSKSAHYAVSVADGQECKSFAFPLTFCFAIGNEFAGSSCRLFSCTKHRRAPGASSVLVEVDGAFGRVRSAEDRFALDPVTNKVVSRAELSTFAQPSDDEVAAFHTNRGRRPIIR